MCASDGSGNPLSRLIAGQRLQRTARPASQRCAPHTSMGFQKKQALVLYSFAFVIFKNKMLSYADTNGGRRESKF
jgi:hypothetical protein